MLPDFVEFGFGKNPSSFEPSSAVLSREGRLYLRKQSDAAQPWSSAYVVDILRCATFSSAGQEILLGETGRENVVVRFAARDASREWFSAIKRTLINGPKLRSGAPMSASPVRSSEVPSRSTTPTMSHSGLCSISSGGIATRPYSSSVSLLPTEAKAAMFSSADSLFSDGGSFQSGMGIPPNSAFPSSGRSSPVLNSVNMVVTRGSSIDLRRSHRKPIEDEISPQLQHSKSSRSVSNSNVSNTNSLRTSVSSPTASSGSDFDSLGCAELADLVADLHEQVRAAKKQVRRHVGTLNSLSRERQTNMIQLSKDMLQARETIALGDHVVYVLDVDQDAIDYVERIGIGSSGTTVYRTVLKGFSFASKVFSLEDSSMDDVDILRREISVLEKLQHENIVALLGYQLLESAREVRIFTELHSGTLRDVIDRRLIEKRYFTPVDIMRFATEIGRGLNYLHSQKPVVIHRDLKSDNIFVQWDSTHMPLKLRIGDFDVSRVLESGKLAFTKAVGQPGYMAPELSVTTKNQNKNKKLAKFKGYDHRCDVWSYGMLIYELICLERPYHEIQQFDIPDLVLAGIRPLFPPMDLEPYRKLIKIFEDCTTLDPKKRPSMKKLLPSMVLL